MSSSASDATLGPCSSRKIVVLKNVSYGFETNDIALLFGTNLRLNKREMHVRILLSSVTFVDIVTPNLCCDAD